MIIKGGVEKEGERKKGEARNKMSHFQINYVDFIRLLQKRETKTETGGESGGFGD